MTWMCTSAQILKSSRWLKQPRRTTCKWSQWIMTKVFIPSWHGTSMKTSNSTASRPSQIQKMTLVIMLWREWISKWIISWINIISLILSTIFLWDKHVSIRSWIHSAPHTMLNWKWSQIFSTKGKSTKMEWNSWELRKQVAFSTPWVEWIWFSGETSISLERMLILSKALALSTIATLWLMESVFSIILPIIQSS